LSAEVNSSESDEKKILFDLPLIKKRLALLTKIVNGRTELEIEVLFAIQVVIHKKDVYTGEYTWVDEVLLCMLSLVIGLWRRDRLIGYHM